jgi:hypothetical protein
MKTLKALALGTIPVVGAFLCILIFQAGNLLDHATRDEDHLAAESIATLEAVNAPCKLGRNCGLISQATLTVQGIDSAVGSVKSVANSANQTLALVNRPCEPAPCGTLADINRTLATARGTMGQVEIAANHEDKNLGTLDAQEATLFADTHKAAQDLDALVNSPDIVASLHNVNASSAAVADSTKQADAILIDAREEADKFVHPPKKKMGFWAAVMAAANVAHKFEPPLF